MIMHTCRENFEELAHKKRKTPTSRDGSSTSRREIMLLGLLKNDKILIFYISYRI